MAHGKPIDFTCSNCSQTVPSPVHCGKPMTIQEFGDQSFWICWKGEHEPCCGSEAKLFYQPCCDNPELILGPSFDDMEILL